MDHRSARIQLLVYLHRLARKTIDREVRDSNSAFGSLAQRLERKTIDQEVRDSSSGCVSLARSRELFLKERVSNSTQYPNECSPGLSSSIMHLSVTIMSH